MSHCNNSLHEEFSTNFYFSACRRERERGEWERKKEQKGGREWKREGKRERKGMAMGETYTCYQFRILRNLRIDIKDRLEEYSQSIEIDIHVLHSKSLF